MSVCVVRFDVFFLLFCIFFSLSWKQGSHLRKVSRGAKKDGGDVSKGRGAAFKDVLDDDGEDEVTTHRCTRAHTTHNTQRAIEGFSFFSRSQSSQLSRPSRSLLDASVCATAA